MIQSNVVIQFSLEPADVDTKDALSKCADLRKDRDALSRSLTASISRATMAPIDWADPPPFLNDEDPRYLQFLVEYSKYLNILVAADASAGLLQLGGFKRDVTTVYSGDTLNRIKVGKFCGVEILLGGGTQCDPCGYKCHKVGGVVHTSCPGGGSLSPLTWNSVCCGKPVAMNAHVSYEFWYFDPSNPTFAAGPAQERWNARHALAFMSEPACVDRADRLHGAATGAGAYPPFWSSFNNDLSILRTIFEFFCRIPRDASPSLMTQLMKRLYLRAKKQVPEPLSPVVKDAFDKLAGIQINAFQSLGKWDRAALDCFASGSLCPDGLPSGPNFVPRTELRFATPPEYYPEPNGAAFYFWADFAVLAAANDARWVRVLQCLLRAQHIYLRAYQPRDASGTPLQCPRFGNYVPKNYQPVLPGDFQNIDYSNDNDLKSLEAEYSKIVQRAFPCGV